MLSTKLCLYRIKETPKYKRPLAVHLDENCIGLQKKPLEVLNLTLDDLKFLKFCNGCSLRLHALKKALDEVYRDGRYSSTKKYSLDAKKHWSEPAKLMGLIRVSPTVMDNTSSYFKLDVLDSFLSKLPTEQKIEGKRYSYFVMNALEQRVLERYNANSYSLRAKQPYRTIEENKYNYKGTIATSLPHAFMLLKFAKHNHPVFAEAHALYSAFAEVLISEPEDSILNILKPDNKNLLELSLKLFAASLDSKNSLTAKDILTAARNLLK